MTLEKIATIAKDLRGRREAAAFCEKTLSDCVSAFIEQYHGSARDLARKLGLSAQYVCDLRHGRRKISNAVLNKLMKLR